MFKYIFDEIKRFFTSLNAKKVLTIATVMLLIIAPTVIAIASITYFDYIHKSELFSVTLYTSDGNEIAHDEQEIDNAEITSLSYIFYEMTVSNPIPAKTKPSEEYKYIRAVTKLNNTESEYKFYFSATDKTGFYTDASGKNYVISEKFNKIFLSKNCSEMFYDTAKIYPLITADGDTITPNNVNWHYKNSYGNYVVSNNNATTDKENTFEITGTLDIFFEKEPDVCNITVFEGDNEIFKDTLDKLSSFVANSKNAFRVVMEAEWKDTADVQNYGTASYDFFVIIKNRSSFSVNADNINAGDFLMINCTNITDISKIKFSSNIESITPIFKRYGSSVCTLIHIPDDINMSTFIFDISYGASKQTFNINIYPTEEKGEYIFDHNIFSSYDKPIKTNTAVIKTLRELSLPQNQTIYFRGNFADPTNSGFNIEYTHNSTVKWGDELEHAYVALGNNYTVKDGATGGFSVPALQHGIVAYVGNDKELGKFVVIDHGFGLRTWYTGLSSTDVETGDVVTKYQQIGKTGVGIFESKEGFTLYSTLYNAVIDPNVLWKNLI